LSTEGQQFLATKKNKSKTADGHVNWTLKTKCMQLRRFKNHRLCRTKADGQM